MNASCLLLFLLAAGVTPALTQNYAGRSVMGEEAARQQVREALKNAPSPLFHEPILPTKESAITVAEAIVFQAYGRKQILTERPYEAYLIDGYWYVTGTLPKGWEGGTFEIILAASDGRVLRLTHGK